MIEVIATWSLSFGFSILWIGLATIPWTATLSQLAAETVRWIAKLVGWCLWRDHVSNLLLSALKH